MERHSSTSIGERRLNDDGAEVLDDKPVALPARFKRADNLRDQVQAFVRQEMSALASSNDYESFDEADDFDVDDIDFDPRSRYELDDGALDYNIRLDPKYEHIYKKEEDVGRHTRDAIAAKDAEGQGVEETDTNPERSLKKRNKAAKGNRPTERGNASDISGED